MCAPNCENALPEADQEARFFNPSTKCCTYHPNLPNFLVGAILADDTSEGAEGKRRLEQKIAARTGITPFGVNAPPKYNFLYQNTKEFFGRAPSMLCPYYVSEGGGLCSIWKYRESVCSTYFCKYVAGADGRRFWMSLKSYLTLIEIQLARYATLQIYPKYIVDEKHPGDSTTRLAPEDLEDGPAPAKNYASWWGTWSGLEKEFYIECHRVISSLTAKDVERIVGLDGEISLTKLQNKHEAMSSSKIPDRLQLNPALSLKWAKDGSVVLGAYSELDALALPAEAYRYLQEFKGDESVTNVRDLLRKKHEADFSDDVLLTLYQHRVLKDPAET
jgi:Fe-S-cluster containining protein